MFSKFKIIGYALIMVLVFSVMFVLTGCFGGSVDNGIVGPRIDNSTDLREPDEDDLQGLDTTKTYYDSRYLNLVTEINGSYKTNRPFTLDEKDESKRIYDNLYFYQDDLFYMGTSDYIYMWCNLSDPNDKTYVETAYSEGVAYQINVKKTGIYKLIFDINRKSFDVEYKGEITTPVYETIEGCDIHSTANGWTTMQRRGDEFYINNYHMEKGKVASFDSMYSHTSHYKTTIDETSLNKYVCKSGNKPKSDIWFMISGTYNIYLNAKTYVVRVELVVADDYSAKVFYGQDGELIAEGLVLTAVAENTPYLFEWQYQATSDVGGYGVVSDNLPQIYNSSNQEYNLTPTADSLSLLGSSRDKYYFKKKGTYKLTINLQDFSIGIEKLPE